MMKFGYYTVMIVMLLNPNELILGNTINTHKYISTTYLRLLGSEESVGREIIIQLNFRKPSDLAHYI